MMECPYCDHVSESMEEHTDHIGNEHQDVLRAAHEGDAATIVAKLQERAEVPVETGV